MNSAFTKGFLGALGAMLPAFFVSGILWYIQQEYDIVHHGEVIGFFATATLSMLAFTSIHPKYFPRVGRFALTSYGIWTMFSTMFRIAFFFDWITVGERLLFNSIVASVLAVIGLYVLFIEDKVTAIYQYLGKRSNGSH